MSASIRRRGPALLGSLAALALTASTPFAAGASAAPVGGADKGSADVVDTETVQVYLDAAGRVQSQRVYEQLVLRGSGSVRVTNPVSTDGLRNLDGFGGVDVRDGAQVASYDLDAAGGVIRERTVSDHEGDVPLEVSVRYLLDGKEVEPGDVVGASGHLEVEYTVENITARTQEVEIPDGHGGTTTRKVPVAVPFAGSMQTTLPANFTDVESERGNLAGDGRGGTKVNFTLTLFPPIGATTTTLAWEADITEGVVPRAELSALPVNPMESPTFATAANGYRNGTASGEQLADGAREMDANLLKLRDGAQDLLGGLVKLHEGAGRLRSGLDEDAVPGARKLADGSKALDAGLAKIDDGAGRLADGSARVSGGLHDAATGSTDLRDGLSRISDGLGKLADVDGLPAAADGAAKLKAGVDQVLAGFGAVGTSDTLLDGLARLETGLGQLSAGLQQLEGGIGQAKGGVDQSKGGVDQSKAGVDQVIAGLDDAVNTGGSIDQLLGGLQLLTTLDCGPVCQGVVTTKLLPGVQDSKKKLTDARNGLSQVTGGLGQVSVGLGKVSGGLGQAVGGLQTQLVPGAQQAAAGAIKANAGAQRLAGGLGEIRTGLSDLETGLTKAVAGVLALDAGAGDAHAGAGELSAGLGLLDDGAGAVADGNRDLAAGAREAHDGSGKVAGGNAELATGLEDAADGSGQLADGLGKARGGAPKIVDGAGRLSDEGAKVMAGKGETAAQDYGELVAVMEAGAKRADAEKMAYGAPEGALGLTAYNVVIEGEDGATGRNLTRGLVGGGLLAATAGVVLLRRRLV